MRGMQLPQPMPHFAVPPTAQRLPWGAVPALTQAPPAPASTGAAATAARRGESGGGLASLVVGIIGPAAVAAAVLRLRRRRQGARLPSLRRAVPGRQQGDGMGLGPEGPSEREIDFEFSSNWTTFVQSYFSPRQRLERWWRNKRQGGGRLQNSRPNSLLPGPPPQECAMAAMAYLLPLAGGLHCAQPLFAAYPIVAFLCAPLAMLALPCASPLGAALASAWLLCAVADRRTVQSYFVRYNFCQALVLGAFLMLPGCLAEVFKEMQPPSWLSLLRGLWPTTVGRLSSIWGLAGLSTAPPSELLMSASLLGLSVLACTWSSARCLRGRFPDRIPAVSAVTNRQVKW